MDVCQLFSTGMTLGVSGTLFAALSVLLILAGQPLRKIGAPLLVISIVAVLSGIAVLPPFDNVPAAFLESSLATAGYAGAVGALTLAAAAFAYTRSSRRTTHAPQLDAEPPPDDGRETDDDEDSERSPDRIVTHARRDEDGDILALGKKNEWSRAKDDVIADIEQGARYWSEGLRGNRSPISVVRPRGGSAYLRTRGDHTTGNNLDELPEL